MQTSILRIILIAIVMLMGTNVAMSITRQQLASYAQSLKGIKKEELKDAAYELMSEKTVLDYGSGTNKTWWGFYVTDRVAETNECINRYSDQKFYFSSRGSAPGGMNIEHSFAKSWWGSTQNDAYRDLFNLYPSDSKANSAKSNYVMGEINLNDSYKSLGEGAGYVGKGYAGSNYVSMWEPGDQYKGDFARSYMYMATTYQHFTWESAGLNQLTTGNWPTLQEWSYVLFLKWSKQDKIDAIEVARNNAVYGIQSNRNLFVDYPYLSEYIWGDSTHLAFNPETSITTASDDDRYNGSVIPDDSNQPEPEETVVYTRTKTVPTADTFTALLLVDKSGSLLSPKPLSPSSGKDYGYLYGTTVAKTAESITVYPDVIEPQLLTFVKQGSVYLLKNSNGKYYYTKSSYNNYTHTDNQSEAAVWTISINTDGTANIKDQNTQRVMMYSTQHSSFGAYDSAPNYGIYPYIYLFDAEATGVSSVLQTKSDDSWYDLKGQRMNRPVTPGVYIRNGKKYILIHP